MVLGKIIDYISCACIPKEEAPDFSLSHMQQPKQQGRGSARAPALCEEAQQFCVNSSAEEIGSKLGYQKAATSSYCLQCVSVYFFASDSMGVTNPTMPL